MSCTIPLKRAQKLFAKLEIEKPIYDAIIVPGTPFQNGQWDSIMKARVLWSVYLYKNHYTQNIIFSGASVYSPFYESKIMGLYAQELGVQPSHIFYDTLAKHSTENVYYSYILSKKNHFKKIALATDPFQSYLLTSFLRRRFASPIAQVPINFNIIRNINMGTPNIDSMKAFNPHFVSILNAENAFKRFKGTLGKQIYYGADGKLGRL
ncbi:MAG: YdcF family protein [Chitinophagaceae bacterium]|nr:YdcF family protein [Chitinophagaceae bacterium]